MILLLIALTITLTTLVIAPLVLFTAKETATADSSMPSHGETP